MNCPHCENKAITFYQWSKGIHWIKTSCNECGTSLIASGTTFLLAVLSIVIAVAAAVICHAGLGIESPVVVFSVGFGFLLGGGILTWYCGGYRIAGASNTPSALDADGERPYSGLIKIGRTLFGICILALIVGRVINRVMGGGKGGGLTSGMLMILIPIWACGVIGIVLMLVGWIGNKLSRS